MYASDKDIKLAESLGYKHERSTNTGSSFQKDNRRIWSIRDGWQPANIINSYYMQHAKFESLEDAINRPL